MCSEEGRADVNVRAIDDGRVHRDVHGAAGAACAGGHNRSCCRVSLDASRAFTRHVHNGTSRWVSLVQAHTHMRARPTLHERRAPQHATALQQRQEQQLLAAPAARLTDAQAPAGNTLWQALLAVKAGRCRHHCRHHCHCHTLCTSWPPSIQPRPPAQARATHAAAVPLWRAPPHSDLALAPEHPARAPGHLQTLRIYDTCAWGCVAQGVCWVAHGMVHGVA